MVTFSPDDPLGASFRSEVGRLLDEFVQARAEACLAISPTVVSLTRLAESLTRGGKRFRPALCYWGAVAVGGQPQPSELLVAAASLDLLHLSALVHDDLMDGSDTRRGAPAAHRALAQEHRAAGLLGSADAFGGAGAILLGDLLLMWSIELFAGSGLADDAHRRAQPLLDTMRTEVTVGQYLDVLATTRPLNSGSPDLFDEVRRVVEYKTARYTMIRPAQVGAAIAGASSDQLATLAAFGSPLGRAFQFRDDLLGAFGDPALTGKPAGDDLREGKRTVLVAYALARAEPNASRRLADLLGRPDLEPGDIDDCRGIIEESGARSFAELEIARGHEEALTALASGDLTDEGTAALTRLSELAVDRVA